MRLHYHMFGGMDPKRQRFKLSNANPVKAELAVNAWLQGGELRGYPNDSLILDASDVPIRTLHKLASLDCCPGPLVLGYCASVTEVNSQICNGFRHVLIWSHDACHPHKRMDPCTGESWLLTVEAPVVAPVVTPVGGSQLQQDRCGSAPCSNEHKGPDEVAYLTTYVDVFGTESLPGPPSRPALVWDDQSRSISNIAVNPPPNAVAVRIYRTTSAGVFGKEHNTFSTAFQLVTELELPVAGNAWLDSRRLADIDWGPFNRMYDCPPPVCMDKVEYTDDGYWVGYHDRTLYISERNEFWNWPERYRITIPERITGLVTFGPHIFVGTSGTPYRGQLKPTVGKAQGLSGDPTVDQEFDTEITLVPFAEQYPCLQKQTMVRTSWGAAYVSNSGIVALRTAGPAVNLLKNKIEPDAWMRYAPNQMAWHDGLFYGVRTPTKFAIVFDPRETGEAATSQATGDFITLDLAVDLLHSGGDGRLYYATGSRVYSLGTARGRKPYLWRSGQTRTPGTQAMTAFRVHAEYGTPVKFKLFVDGRKVHEQSVQDGQPHRLPAHCHGSFFAIELSGTTTVLTVDVAPSMADLTTVVGQDQTTAR